MTAFPDYARCYVDESPATAASKILVDLGVHGDAFDCLYPVVANAVRMLNRASTRTVERIASGIIRTTDNDADEIATRHEARLELMSKGFATRTWGWVRWGEATVAQHEERIAMLARIRGGIDDTIDLHAEAIAEITAAGAACLNEVRS